MAIDGIQSVDRSLEILRIIAEKKQVTATELAGILGIHQSSASRHLKSLYDAGYVRKPDFHSFAPDYGILLFAGTAMKAFPLVESSAEICSSISAKYGVGAAVAVLVRNRIVYLSWLSPDDKRTFHIVDDSDFPVFKSSMGLVLSYMDDSRALGKRLSGCKDMARREAERLFETVDSQMKDKGCLYLRDFHANRFNAAIGFESPDGSGHAALAIFSRNRLVDGWRAEKILQESISRIIFCKAKN
ncbi:MAG: helix-turn-helix domain-containing protein [Victivallales bacterium]